MLSSRKNPNFVPASSGSQEGRAALATERSSGNFCVAKAKRLEQLYPERSYPEPLCPFLPEKPELRSGNRNVVPASSGYPNGVRVFPATEG